VGHALHVDPSPDIILHAEHLRANTPTKQLFSSIPCPYGTFGIMFHSFAPLLHTQPLPAIN